MTAPSPVLAPLLLGLALGIRHALDPDHLAAMGTIVARERSPRRAAVLGSVWGMGHSTSLLLVSLALVVLPTLPDRPTALAYVALFGIGSIGGMALWSAALAVPLGRLTRPGSPFKRWVPVLSGVVSVGCGIVLATQAA